MTGHRDGRGLFGDHEHGGVGLLGQSQRGAVAGAERLVRDLELGERKHAAGADDAVAPHQHGAVVQRRVRREDGGEQVGRHLGLHRDAGRDELLEPDVALDGDDGPGAGTRQPVHRLGDLLGHRLALALREAAQEPRLTEPGQGVPQLGLEHHHGRERAEREDVGEQRADHRELGEQRREVGDRQDHDAHHDLHRPRPDQEQQEAVDDGTDRQNLAHARPEPRDQEPVGFEVHGALVPFPVVAPATRSASQASAASWTRNRRAPRSHASAHATAVARSRSSTGRPVAAPRKRLRDGPTATGYPKPTTVASSSSSRKFCSAPFANPNPGSTTMRSCGTPASSAPAAAAASSAATSAATCRYTASPSIVSGVPRMCMTITPAPPSATTRASSGSKARPDTSLITAAPAASAARATAALRVSTDTGPKPRRASCSITGATRAISSGAATGAAPGRVDSPPTSSSSHPSATSRSACATARSAVEKRPPSEKESGVTFTIPISTGWSRASVRPAISQRRGGSA